MSLIIEEEKMSERYYTEDHEWVEFDQDVATVGVSSHAVTELGEIVFVELPDLGKAIAKGDECASVESVKTVSGVYAPVDGEVLERNETIVESPELINQSPYESGWLIRLKGSESFDTSDLMDETAYDNYLKTI